MNGIGKLKGGIVKELPKNLSVIDLFTKSRDTVELIGIEDLQTVELDFLAQNGMSGPGKKKIIIYDLVESFCKENNLPLLIRELPVIRTNTDGWWRFSWNTFFCDEGIYPYDELYDRWSQISDLCQLRTRDWHRPGDSVLFCLQKSRDSALNKLHQQNYEYLQYCIDTINQIKLNTDRKIIVRSHPRDTLLPKVLQETFPDIEFSSGNSLNYDFQRSWCCITYNSNSAVEAALHGIPLITLDSSSPAREVSHHSISDIEKNVDFNLHSWLKKISFMQWSPEEIHSGKAWSFLKKVYPH